MRTGVASVQEALPSSDKIGMNQRAPGAEANSAFQAADLANENDRLLAERAADGRLYALVDPFFELPPGVRSRDLETRDTDPAFYDAIAWEQVTYEPPRLAKVDPDALKWFLFSLSTERWGAFVVSSAEFETVARHFQKFVIARGPDQNPYFLRFHDASVLEVLLRTWTPRDREIFFGPADAFGLPDLDDMSVRIAVNPAAGGLRALPRPEECLLSLGRSQLEACGLAIDRDLVKVIGWHLRNHHAKSVQHLAKALLEERVEFAVGRARRYSLGTVSDLAGFTALMFELAPNFDEHPSFKRVLSDPTIPPETKIKRLSQAITDREWDEAQSQYDRAFWPTALKKRGK